MPRNFSFVRGLVRLGAAWKEPKTLIRLALGVLLLANLVAAAFAFHWIGDSSETVGRQLTDARHQTMLQQARLAETKKMDSKVVQARLEGDNFIATYMTTRRSTYSTILNELHQTAAASGMSSREASITLDPVEGSDTLSEMTISANFEGTYGNVLRLVNALDKSPRFLIIESTTTSPQASGVLSVNIKLNLFVRDDNGGIS